MRLRVRAKAAKEDGKLQFTALLHHVSVDLLRSSYQSLKKRAAAGVDGVTREEYGEGLEERLTDLHGRIHRGAYQAQPSRRVWIPKPDGRERPLGIAALEDKIVQRAAGEMLNSIWEGDFKGFSYGFRPGRSQQGSPLVSGGIGCAVRRDHKREGELGAGLGIKSFFDKIEHEWLVKFVEHRIADKRIVRLIQKWLDQLAQMHGPLVRG